MKEVTIDLDEMVRAVGRLLIDAEAASTAHIWQGTHPAPVPPLSPDEWDAWWTETRRIVQSLVAANGVDGNGGA